MGEANSSPNNRSGQLEFGRCRVIEPIISLLRERKDFTLQKIPVGTYILVDANSIKEDKFISVSWGEEMATILAEDLRLRAELVAGPQT